MEEEARVELAHPGSPGSPGFEPGALPLRLLFLEVGSMRESNAPILLGRQVPKPIGQCCVDVLVRRGGVEPPQGLRPTWF
jgi:hypothetical protein